MSFEDPFKPEKVGRGIFFDPCSAPSIDSLEGVSGGKIVSWAIRRGGGAFSYGDSEVLSVDEKNQVIKINNNLLLKHEVKGVWNEQDKAVH